MGFRTAPLSPSQSVALVDGSQVGVTNVAGTTIDQTAVEIAHGPFPSGVSFESVSLGDRAQSVRIIIGGGTGVPAPVASYGGASPAVLPVGTTSTDANGNLLSTIWTCDVDPSLTPLVDIQLAAAPGYSWWVVEIQGQEIIAISNGQSDSPSTNASQTRMGLAPGTSAITGAAGKTIRSMTLTISTSAVTATGIVQVVDNAVGGAVLAEIQLLGAGPQANYIVVPVALAPSGHSFSGEPEINNQATGTGEICLSVCW